MVKIERGDVGGCRLAAGHLADAVHGVETSSFTLSSSQLQFFFKGPAVISIFGIFGCLREQSHHHW